LLLHRIYGADLEFYCFGAVWSGDLELMGCLVLFGSGFGLWAGMVWFGLVGRVWFGRVFFPARLRALNL